MCGFLPSIAPLVADAPLPEDSHVLRGDAFALVLQRREERILELTGSLEPEPSGSKDLLDERGTVGMDDHQPFGNLCKLTLISDYKTVCLRVKIRIRGEKGLRDGFHTVPWIGVSGLPLLLHEE